MQSDGEKKEDDRKALHMRQGTVGGGACYGKAKTYAGVREGGASDERVGSDSKTAGKVCAKRSCGGQAVTIWNCKRFC